VALDENATMSPAMPMSIMDAGIIGGCRGASFLSLLE
jgi:hypothetical protein